MTVNEAIIQMQMMIDRGVITGSEQFGYFVYAGYRDAYFEEAKGISVECNWEDSGDVVYLDAE